MRHLGVLALGGVVAVLSVLVHRTGPVGLALALVTSLATAEWLRRGVLPSLASAYCLGWVVVLGVVLTGRPEGDWAIGGDPRGYSLMAAGLVLVVDGVVALPRGGPAPRT